MSVLPLHLPTYSKNRHFSFFSPYMSQDVSKFLPIVVLFLWFLPNLLDSCLLSIVYCLLSIVYSKYVGKKRKKTNFSKFSATRTYLKLIFISIFSLFFYEPFPKTFVMK